MIKAIKVKIRRKPGSEGSDDGDGDVCADYDTTSEHAIENAGEPITL